MTSGGRPCSADRQRLQCSQHPALIVLDHRFDSILFFCSESASRCQTSWLNLAVEAAEYQLWSVFRRMSASRRGGVFSEYL